MLSRTGFGKASVPPYPELVNAAEADEQGASAAADDAPRPRRTGSGAVIVGPTIRARYLPGALIGLPLVSVVLAPFAAAGLQQWRRTRVQDGYDTWVEHVLAPAWTQLATGWLLMWALFALWAIVPMLLTHRAVRLDQSSGTLVLRRGLRTADRAQLDDLQYAVGEAERGSIALIGVRRPGSRRSEPAPERRWVIPEIGWDDASFDGLRTLQSAAGLRPAPPRPVLVAEARRRRRAELHREYARRLGMPWKDEYAHDEEAFQAEFDRVRRVLGGKEPAREGDPRP